ncbi:pyridoxal-phosphate dependent enzyme [Nocardia africana]
MTVADPQLGVFDSVADAIGNTPLIRLNRVTEGITATVYLKLEYLNPFGSVKDRAARAMIDAAQPCESRAHWVPATWWWPSHRTRDATICPSTSTHGGWDAWVSMPRTPHPTSCRRPGCGRGGRGHSGGRTVGCDRGAGP